MLIRIEDNKRLFETLCFIKEALRSENDIALETTKYMSLETVRVGKTEYRFCIATDGKRLHITDMGSLVNGEDGLYHMTYGEKKKSIYLARVDVDSSTFPKWQTVIAPKDVITHPEVSSDDARDTHVYHRTYIIDKKRLDDVAMDFAKVNIFLNSKFLLPLDAVHDWQVSRFIRKGSMAENNPVIFHANLNKEFSKVAVIMPKTRCGEFTPYKEAQVESE